MARENAKIPRVLEIAQLIEEDIARRGLGPGDRYLNASEAAAMLRVGKQAANQAMQLLTQRGVLERKQRRGTYIAEPPGAAPDATLQAVFILVHRDHPMAQPMPQGVVAGIQRGLPDARVQVMLMPPADEEAFTDEAVRRCRGMNRPAGLVLVRSTLAMQRIVEESGLPAVIYGTLQPSITRLPAMERDQYQMGRLLAGRVAASHRHVIVLMRDRMLPGDHRFLDGVASRWAEEGLGVETIVHRDLPNDHEAIRCEVRRLLEGPSQKGSRVGGAAGPGLPGVIARDEVLADGAALALMDLGLRPGCDATIVVADAAAGAGGRRCPYPHIVADLGAEAQGEVMARLLASMAACPPARRPESVVIPVSLASPTAGLACLQ